MGSRSRIWIVLVAFSAVALVLGACTRQAPSPSPVPKAEAPKPAPAVAPKPTAAPKAEAPKPGGPQPSGTLTVAVADWGNDTFAPSTAMGPNRYHWDLMYNYLTVFTKDRKMAPSLATSWEMSKDGMTWTIVLRKDVKFHNGDPLTAEDVKYSIEDAIVKGSISTGAPMIRASLQDIEVMDPYRLVLRMKQPAMQSAIMTPIHRYVAIVPRNYREKVGSKEFEKRPIGTGPYKLAEHKIGDSFKFEAFEGYWGPKPAFQTITIKSVPEEATRVAMLKRGEADIVSLALSSKKEVEAAGFEIRAAKQMFVNNVVFEGIYLKDRATYDPKNPFLDIRVRKALNLAINREEIVKQIYMGSAVPAGMYPFMPGLEGWDDKWKPYPYDQQQAKKLLAEAGYAGGFKATMYLYEAAGAPDLPLMSEAIAMYWANIGVNVQFQKSTWAALKPALETRKVSGSVLARRADANEDAFNRLNTELSSWSVTGGYETPETDKLIKTIGATLDFETRDKLNRQLGQIFYDQYATAPVAFVDSIYGVSKKVGEWQLKPFNALLSLETARPR